MTIDDKWKKVIVFVALGVMIISAFFIRLENFQSLMLRSTDEVAYVRMAIQVGGGLEHYNSIPFAKWHEAQGRELPDYFHRPLFKHPPLFTLFLSMSMRALGIANESAFYVSVFFSLAMFPLIYFLGKMVYSWRVGLVAAFIYYLDPMTIICSQKVWMETMLAFFYVLALYTFIKALKTKTYRLFIYAGILSGLGALTKYTGGLATVVMFSYALLYERDLFKNTKFIIGLLMPFIMLLPWFYWNLQVFGMDFIGLMVKFHSSKFHFSIVLRNVFLFLVAGYAIYKIVMKFREDIPDFKKVNLLVKVILAVGLFVIFFGSIFLSFRILHVPYTSWSGAKLYGSAHTFYVDRLLEFSTIYFFAFVGFFIPNKDMQPSERVVRIGIFTMLIFFTIWTAFQSRYIISAVPLLILMGISTLGKMYNFTDSIEKLVLRVLWRSAVIIVFFLAIAKLQFINQMISFPNNFCYF